MCIHNLEDDYLCCNCCAAIGRSDAEEGLPPVPEYKNWDQVNAYYDGYDNVLKEQKVQKITTETGSVYLIDLKNKTWERIKKTEESGPIRTDGGSIQNELPLQIGIGEGLNIFTDRLNECSDYRLIRTSSVVKIEPV